METKKTQQVSRHPTRLAGGFLPESLNFEQQIEYIRKSGIGTPKSFTIDLSVANQNLEIGLAGNFIYALTVKNVTDWVNIRFNELRESTFRLTQQLGFYTPYYRFFLDNDAQAGAAITFVYGTLSKEFLDILDNRSAALQAATLAGILAELQGDTADEGFNRVAVGAAATLIRAANANRKSIIIQHAPDGVGHVCLGFDNTVTVAKYFISLAPGDWYSVSDYRGTIYGIRTAGATNAQYGEV